ncbi:MAG: ParB/RepB/Spo0J family partition protein [Oscillospiraceae bacterium]|nr:ParB/RepB/Spo0J family partition protein [Oscillospiraceae bacterium]
MSQKRTNPYYEVSSVNLMPRGDNKIIEISTIKIRPNKTQPRKIFEETQLRALAQSIAQNGILQPLTVRKLKSGEYELIAGERRLRASVMAGLTKVPCIEIRCSDKESAVLALLENLQRCDLGMFEEAKGINRLIRRYGLTQEQAAQQLGKRQSTIANKLRLLKLSFEEQDWIIQAGLSERHARALLKIQDDELRKEALSKMISENLNVSQSEEMISGLLAENSVVAKKTGKSMLVVKDVRIFVNTINKAVDTMRLAGIDAISKKQDNGDYIEYTIKIPKQQSQKTRTA